MPLSIRALKFLLDENVRRELHTFLKQKGYDCILAPKATTDKKIATLSLRESRILVTNDEDFTEYTKGEVFCVIWLRLPQSKPEALLTSFQRLLRGQKHFSEKLFVVTQQKVDELPLAE